ncbi:uncharacterized protein LOC117789876 isoform X2 [Drosophila innubila]|uniref:uncharacterized protein LOC117789876 isoform X2 n=1 Tax=Drosophila innubila TaxID=198719 RepID=UPI00148D49C7|nr:uncharacterized protein LOC117789876 isoform X2 [Drosophila innubila]
MAKMQKNKDVFDSTDFPVLLSTLSMKEVMVLEFRFVNVNKWENMVSCTNPQKRLYSCNVCQVSQSSEKNLFSHLMGKKHILKMNTVKQIRLPKGYGETSQIEKSPIAQLTTEPKIIVKTPSSIKNTKAEVVTSNNISISTVQQSKKKQVAPNLNQIVTKTVPNKMETKADAETIITKKNIAPKIDLVSKPNIPDEAPIQDLISTPKTTVEAPKNDLISTLKTTVEATNKELVLKPKTEVEASKKELVSNPKTPEISNDAIKTPNKNQEANNSTATNSKNNTMVSSITPTSKSLTSSVNEIDAKSKTSNLPTNVAEELSDHCNVEKFPQKETKTKTITVNLLKPSSHSNVVINPLSKAAASVRKISCVPISKLISQAPPEVDKMTVDVDDDDVVSVPESPSKEIEINIRKKDKSNENTNVIEKVVTTSASDGTIPVSPTFESSSHMTDVLGLLGVEYVLKIVKSISDKDPRFLCTLCNITTDELSMHNHLLSNTHRLKYCEEHFPTAIRQYKQYVSEVPEHQVHKILTPILNKLAKAIETHHGRENSYLCYERWFTKNKKSLISTAFNRRHASEALGPTFIHVIDSTEVDVLIENATRTTDQPANNLNVVNKVVPFNPFNASSNRYSNHHAVNNYRPAVPVNTNYLHNIETVDDETHKRMVENFLRDTRHAQPNRHRNPSRKVSKRDRSRSNSTDRKRNRTTPVLISQWNIERRSISPLRDGDIWQAYRHMVDQSIRELNTTFDLYKSDPEQHPNYKDEWQKFWKRRKDELIAAGINHRSYNFQNEWILFFNARLEELYNQDVENIKIKCRERLCLPMTNTELENPKYHVNISDDISEPESPKKTQQKNANENPTKLHESLEEVNVIHVLRLLTALENYLGSLGPNITELLAKALQVSKVHPNKIDQLILTSENCDILETAKEKFTGLIISKILDSNQERALKKAVNDTESLLAYASKIRAQHTSRDVDPVGSTAVDQLKASSYHGTSQKSNSNSSNKAFDKSDLVTKLASSLISQGKTSINQEQLKQIIQVYSLIEQKKQQETPSTTRPASNLVNNSSSNLIFKQTKAPNEMEFSESTNNNFTAQNRNQQSYNPNHNTAVDRRTFSNQRPFMNSNMTSNLYNMKTSSNYFSANMARNNNTNYNQNTNDMDYTSSGQEPQFNQHDGHLFDSAQFTRNRNPSSSYIDRSYSFGPTDGNTGEKPPWMQ